MADTPVSLCSVCIALTAGLSQASCSLPEALLFQGRLGQPHCWSQLLSHFRSRPRWAVSPPGLGLSPVRLAFTTFLLYHLLRSSLLSLLTLSCWFPPCLHCLKRHRGHMDEFFGHIDKQKRPAQGAGSALQSTGPVYLRAHIQALAPPTLQLGSALVSLLKLFKNMAS